MRIGDKVICINCNGYYRSELYKVYTIRHICVNVRTRCPIYLQVDSLRDYFPIDRFITVPEYRKQKLLKLKNDNLVQ